jgi:hypothetical protein
MIDRHPKRQILMITQAGFLFLGVIMTAIVYLHVVQ